MSLNVTFNGAVYIVPETGEVGWGGNTTSYLVAIAAGALQKTGGSFTLSAETDFGASFGLKSLYYKSRSAIVAAAGILRLANNSDSINFRNAANSADLALMVNASNELLYNGNQILTGTGPSSYVSSITGTANQVNASASTGAVTLSLPQSINTGASVQFGTLALGSTLTTSAIMSLASTTLGFLPPRMTTVQRDAIATPATGLLIYNTTNNQYDSYNGSAWVALAMSGGGTVNVGIQYQLGYYAANGTSISGLPLITASRALASDVNGLPVASVTTAAELAFVNGVTSAIQTQFTGKASTTLNNLGTTAVNTEITPATNNTIDLGDTTKGWRNLYLADSIKSGVTILATTTELGYLTGVTSAIQTQLNTKATDSLVVHLAGTETITGLKTVSVAGTQAFKVTDSSTYTISFGTLNTDTGSIYVAGSAKLALGTNSVDQITLDATGDTGFGTALPGSYNSAARKIVLASTTGAIGLTLKSNSNSNCNIGFTDAEGTTLQGLFQYSHNATAADEAINLRVGSSDLYKLDGAGRVGLGTQNISSYNSNADNLIVAENASNVGQTIRCATNGNNFIGFTDAEGTTLQGLITYAHNATGASERINFRVNSVDDVVSMSSANGTAIKGTTTNDSAAAGIIGEYLESTSTAGNNFPASNTYGDATSLAITAGEWDVTLQIRYNQNGATWTQALGGISTTSGNSGTGLNSGDNFLLHAWTSSSTTPEAGSITIANFRVQASATTTYYAKVRAIYSAGTPQYQYAFKARRVR